MSDAPSAVGLKAAQDSRVPLNLEVVASLKEHHVQIVKLASTRATVRIANRDHIPPVNTALRMKLRLPIGFWLSGTVLVRSIEPERLEYEVDFGLLRADDTGFVQQQLRTAGADFLPLEAELSVKYRVDREQGALMIWMAGYLTENESAQLAAEIARQRRRVSASSPCVYINASRFAASSRASLDNIKGGLRALSDLPNLVGILVEGSSVARMQVRRLVRDAGLGESLICFADEGEALSAWAKLYDAPSPPSPRAARVR